TAFGAIVYSGSQNVTLALNPMSPMDSHFIQIGDMAGDWDDFRVDLWLDMGMPGMPGMPSGMPMGTGLGIFAPGSMAGSMGMGMGLGMGMDLGMGTAGILGLALFSPNLAMGAVIGPESPFLDSAYLCASGGFGENGGYIGLRTAMGQYGWLHILRQSGIGTASHNVIFDGWAYQRQPGLAIAAGEGGDCDWAAGKPHKMHWPQLPDLGATGLDVDLSQGILADDFRCTSSGPIHDVHLWGSFRDDLVPAEGPGSLVFDLSIYSDVPAANNMASRPGSLLWTGSFAPGQYTARKVHDGPESWYEPATNRFLPNNHRQAFQYNFCIERDPFVQRKGTIYWLAVRCHSRQASTLFGWKTSSLRCRWNDDAVYGVVGATGWRELKYPKQHGYEGQSLDLAFVITGNEETAPGSDLGDAPDSSNSIAGAIMPAYPAGVNARFPTVYQAGSPPYGPIHHKPRSLFYLGKAVSQETEADIGVDDDTVNNLNPLTDAANQDGRDDGLMLPLVMPMCQTTTVNYVVTVTNPLTAPAYVNLWCDWNRDGDWDDVLTCPTGASVPEWAVQNQVPALPGPGTYTITSPAFRCWHPAGRTLDPLWVRITIGELRHVPPTVPLTAAAGIGGAGPAAGYQYGETEDYLVRPTIQAFPVRYDWGDAPTGATAPGYPTLAVQDGARHVPVGPWLGDAKNLPDAEPDGLPHPGAAGDDTSGDSDERGVVLAPLTAGQPASATIEVNGGGGIVQAWIDFNADRTWQASEEIHDDFLADGLHVLSFVVPDSAVKGETFARFRISTRGGLAPTGMAVDGEVEDHILKIDRPPADGGDKTWCQAPDLTPRGIDICVDGSSNRARVLADDFRCTSRGRLNLIRLWGSWKGDAKGEIRRIHVQIHPDDPVGTEGADRKNLYSQPGPEVLWDRTFSAGEFAEKLYHIMEIGSEWWWDPWSGELKPEGDKDVWLVEMSVKPESGFLQEGSPEKPRLYWLSVTVETTGGQFGWKTRRWPEHFMDDAVRGGGAGTSGAWDELRYPPGHPCAEIKENSIDLAFCLRFTVDNPPVATSQPIAVTQCPPVETTCPALLTTCPVVETCCPTTATRCPVVETQCPAGVTKCPLSETKCPVVATGCPVYETRCPSAETRCPAESTKCPPVQTKCPLTETACPVVSTECPAYETRCPSAATKCPAESTKCPPVQTKCPVVSTGCPVYETRCPSAETRCPAESTKCPPAQTKCPLTETTCPVVSTECPAYETRCPSAETKCPAESTKCPPVQTKCPVVSTECPVYETRCPSAETKCPAESTKCPEVATRCPPAATKCPVVFTQCPRCVGPAGSDVSSGILPTVTCLAVNTPCLTVRDYLMMAPVTR
ncbi:MAG: GEVED domain-containing protein, partial [Planctomycetes bacterium]|nr:GEVED domain-containing protein [Planctomycetota bacterium]